MLYMYVLYVLYVTIVGTLLLHMYSSLISLNYVVQSPEYRATHRPKAERGDRYVPEGR